MPLIKFVHAADLHLDSPFQQIRNEAPDHVAETLHDATFDAWKNIVKLCIAEEADALLVAGDIYDGADRSLRAQRAFIDGLERLDAAGIRSFVCHGNHDPLDGWEANLKYPDRCHRFGPEWETEPVFADDPQRAAVTGISYPEQKVTENLIKKLERRTPGPFQIGLLHANVGGNADHDSYAPCSVEDLAATGIDYWALGHVHTRDILRPAAPTVIYPGNPQGRHPNERGPRGVYVVEVADDRSVDAQFWMTDVVRWEQIELDIAELQSEQDLLDELPRRVDQRLQEADNRPLVLRIDLLGRGLLHGTLRRQGVVNDLREQINDLFQTREPFAWCERISDLTKPQLDLDALAAGSDFTAELIKQSREVQADPAQLKELAAELKPLYDNQRFSFLRKERLGAEEPDPDELASLLREAEAIVLDLLVEDESLKIERIDLDGFGHFAGYSLGPFDAPLTVLLGPNEAGKSTLLAAIRAILFGFPRQRAKEHYPPLEGGRHGGRLHVVSAAGERLLIERHQGARGGPVAISSTESGATLPESALQALLGGHSKTVFEQVFAFTLDELTSDALLKDDEVNGQIYSAGIGAARLPEAVRAIEDQRDKIFAPRGRVHSMARTGRSLEEVQSQLREAAKNAGRFATLTEEAARLSDVANEAARQRDDLQADLGHARQLEQARQPWLELAEAERELEQLTVADFPADGIPRLEQLEERARNAASVAETAHLRVAAAQQAADAQIEHEQILSHGAEISALQSGRDRFLSAVNDLPNRERERDSQQAQLDDALLGLGDDWDVARLDSFLFSSADESEVERHRQILDDARDARRTAQDRRKTAEDALKAAEPQPGDAELLDRRDAIMRLERGRAGFANAVADLPAARAELQAAGRDAERTLADLGPDWNADALDQLDLSVAARGEISELAQRLRQAEDEAARQDALAAQSGDLLQEAQREEAAAREALTAAPQPALDAEAISERRRTVGAMQARLREAEAARQSISVLERQLASVGGPDAGETESRRDWNRIIGGLGVLAGIAFLVIGVALGGDSLAVGLVAGILLAAVGASLFLPSRTRPQTDADSPIARNARDSLRQERDRETAIVAELAEGTSALGIEQINEETLNEAESSLDRATEALRTRDELEHRLSERETRRQEREQAATTAAESASAASNARAEIEREWSTWLARRNLGDNFRPDGVNELVGAATVARQALEAQRRSSEQVERLEQTIAQFTTAVEPLAAQFGIQTPSDSAALEAAAVEIVNRSAAATQRTSDFERATEAANASERELVSAGEREFEAAIAWSGWLAQHRLNITLAPSAVLRLRDQVDTAQAQHRHLQDTEHRIAGINDIISDYAEAVSTLAGAFEIPVDVTSPASVEVAAQRLIDLHAAVASAADNRRVAAERLAEAEQAQAEAQADLDAARGELAALLDRGDALPDNDLALRAEDFRRRAAAFEERQAALEQKAALERQLRLLLGSDERYDASIAQLRSLDQQQIEATCERIEGLVEDAAKEYGEASEQLGTVRQQLADLGGESESSGLRMERERLIEQARGDAREWATHQLANWLLAETRKKFEAERQPDVVRHAQDFLAAASGGRYRSVQAPLGEQQINVVEAGGAAKQPAQLSRGTREQLYLALRFGLIRELGARTEPLPVVVDEVLVNFDPARAAQAAQAFHQLAKTHQVLVFTCHPETVGHFEAAAAESGAPPPAVIELQAG